MTTLKVGDQIDVKEQSGHSDIMCWFTHTITNINDTTITTKSLYGWDSTLSKSELHQRTAPLNTHTIKVTKFSQFPNSLAIRDPKPMYNSQNNSIIILSSINDTIIVHQYNIENDKFEELPVEFTKTQFVNDPILQYYKYSLNSQQNILYLLSPGDLLKVNLNTFQITKIRNNERYVSAAYISSPANEFHAICSDFHFRYNDAENKFNKLEAAPLFNPQMIYVEKLQKLFILEGYDYERVNDEIEIGFSSDIYYCNICEAGINTYKWHKFALDLSEDVTGFCLGFGHILFCFAPDTNIWALDLLNVQKFQYNGIKQFSYISDCGQYFIKTNDNNVHVMDTQSDVTNHWAFSLFDVIPESMTQFYCKQYSVLVDGYIRKMKYLNLLTYNFPSYLNKIILFYFPFFV
eukprot:114561_1